MENDDDVFQKRLNPTIHVDSLFLYVVMFDSWKKYSRYQYLQYNIFVMMMLYDKVSWPFTKNYAAMGLTRCWRSQKQYYTVLRTKVRIEKYTLETFER